MKNKWLPIIGFTIPLIFWLTNLICGIILKDYSHVKHLVSELGSLGTKSQYIFTSGLVICSILSLLFVIGLYRRAIDFKLSTIPILLILSFTISILGAAIFPYPHRLHEILGSPSILLFLSPFMSFILWSGKLPGVKYFSLLIFVIMSFGFLIYIPTILTESVGLKQRFFHIGWSIWFCYLGFRFHKIDGMPSKDS